MAYHLTLRHKFLQQLIAYFQGVGFLKPQVFGGRHHLLIEMLRQFACVALENLLGFAYVLLIFVPRLLAYAASFAVVEVVFETGLVAPKGHSLACDGLVATTGFEHLVDEVEHVVHGRDMGVGTEVCASLFVDGTRLENAGEKLVCDTDAWVGLAIL